MTKTEFNLLIKQFTDRKNKAMAIRDKKKFNKETVISDALTRNYLQGGIDTLTTIIEGLEKRYNQLTKNP